METLLRIHWKHSPEYAIVIGMLLMLLSEGISQLLLKRLLESFGILFSSVFLVSFLYEKFLAEKHFAQFRNTMHAELLRMNNVQGTCARLGIREIYETRSNCLSETNKWADEDHKWQIIEERKFMWHPTQIDRIASVIGLSPGMTIADIGCGLGYLGWTYWKYFGQGGTYTGIDCSSELVSEATELSSSWSEGGTASFITGDCYSVPLENDTVDVCMCQTLLQHLEFPERAIKEMVRVTKPGGTVVCKDIDNISRYMKISYSSITEDEEIEEILFQKRMKLIYAKGRKKLGLGDMGIGGRIPRLMHEAGLSQIEGFCNERLEFLNPPYKDPEQTRRIEIIQRFNVEATEEEKKKAKDDYRKYFLAGGGNPETFESDYQRLVSITTEISRRRSESISSESLFSCSGGNNFLCVLGRKK